MECEGRVACGWDDYHHWLECEGQPDESWKQTVEQSLERGSFCMGELQGVRC